LTTKRPQKLNRTPKGYKMYITALEQVTKTKKPYFLDYNFKTLAEFLTIERTVPSKKKIPVWSPASFRSKTSLTNDNVDYVSCAVFDVDDGTPFDSHLAFDRFQYIAHTTFSHTKKKNKWRLIIPFENPVPARLWEPAWLQCKEIFEEITTQKIDEACKDARRFYYVSAKTKEGLFEYHINNSGQSLIVDFEKCNQFLKKRKQEQQKRIEIMKRRASEIRNLPHYAQDPREELVLQLSIDYNARYELGSRIGGRPSTGSNKRMVGWSCPNCGKSDATYFYIDPLNNPPMAFCGHLNNCKFGRWTLFQLGRLKGIC